MFILYVSRIENSQNVPCFREVLLVKYIFLVCNSGAFD